MTFLRPELLLVGPAAAALALLALLLQWRRLRGLARALDRNAARRLVPRRLKAFPAVRMLCLTGACLALVAAAAEPRAPVVEPPEPAPPLDLAIAVDVSLSMSAADVAPTRIERAREVVDELTRTLDSARIVLVLFADWPYTLVPPTDDLEVVRYFARSLSADLVLDRDQGTSLSSALEHAHAALDARSRPGARRAILLVSDGGAHEPADDVLRAAAAAFREGVSVWTAGVGTSSGVALQTESGPVLAASGAAAMATFDEELLRGVARAGGGAYASVNDDAGLSEIARGFMQTDARPTGPDDGARDAAFWLALLVVPLLLWEGALDAGRGPARLRDHERVA